MRAAIGARVRTTILPVAVLLSIATETFAEKLPCVGGFAGPYQCNGIDLLAHLPLASIGGGSGNDIWGWTDPLTGKEYALVGHSQGTSFVDVSVPESPVYLGSLPTHTVASQWRDIKVFQNHAYVVSEAPGHGLQVFDLSALRIVTSPPTVFAESAYYGDVGNAHNVAINEDTGFAFITGVGSGTTCSGGLHIVDIRNPTSPSFAGCFSADGYTHDAQCVVYHGPDSDYAGREVCFNANEDTLTIVDVTDKASPIQISRTGYAGQGYAHQGWLTEDHEHFLLDDESDELDFGHPTRTYLWDVSDLDTPFVGATFTNTTDAIDHNQYVRGQHVYQANYTAGLRILDLSTIASGTISEVAYFDVYPLDDVALASGGHDETFNGAWSVYPYFGSGIVVVNSIDDGLFVLQPSFTANGAFVCDLSADVSGGTLRMELALGAEAPASWNLNLFAYNVSVPVVSSLPLPAVAPPLAFSLDVPSFPDFGTIGLLHTLVTGDGLVCSTFVTVDSSVP